MKKKRRGPVINK